MTPRAIPPRIVVSGVGVVSAWGWGTEPFRSAIARGGTAIAPFRRFDHSGYATHVAAEVPEPPGGFARRPGRSSYRSVADRFAVAAAREAVAAASLPEDLSGLAAGVFFGSSTGGMLEAERFYERWHDGSVSRAPRCLLIAHLVGRPAEAVARELRVTGPVETVSSACASATMAIGLALEALRQGTVQIALAGGADSLCRTTFGGFNALRAVDPRPCRPFHRDRAGLSLGEGGAVLVLERFETARARNATPLAELAGAGASSDAHHMTAPEPGGHGASLALWQALRDARVEPEGIDLINAHGTATPLNDIAEFRALQRVFGSRLREIPLVATKGSVGHLLGCAGAIEAVATVLALHEQRLHPSAGDGELDPEIRVNLVREPGSARLKAALSLNLGFGGCNGALVFKRCGAV